MNYEPCSVVKHTPTAKILGIIEEGSYVLDVGCFAGFLGMNLKKMKNCRVVGLDNDPPAINIAKGRLDRAVLTDIESGKINMLRNGAFDYVVFADVLEHTREPEAVLEEFLTFLKPGGTVIVSLPNVAHPLVRLRMLSGRWDYTDVGVMDRTHLRFFTYRTARKMLEDSGLAIESDMGVGRLVLKKTMAAQFVFVCRRKR